MNKQLVFEIICVVVASVILITYLVKKDKLPIKYALLWYIPILIILILLLFPSILSYVSIFLGFEVLSNMIVYLVLGILLFITLSLTVIVSKQKKQIYLLIQEVSLLKEKCEKNTK